MADAWHFSEFEAYHDEVCAMGSSRISEGWVEVGYGRIVEALEMPSPATRSKLQAR